MVYETPSYTAEGTDPIRPYPNLPPDVTQWINYRFVTGLPNGTDLRADAAVRYTLPQTDDIRMQFRELADTWHRETGHLSSPPQIALHPAYQQIIGMGPAAIPFILEDLQQRGGQWYWALIAINRQSPPMGPMPTAREIKDAWLRWGRQYRLIDPQLQFQGI